MVGSYDNVEQAATDSAFYKISLQMKPVWQKRKDGFWLYVEQAMLNEISRPYRQRMYHLYLQDDSILVSQVFEFKEPSLYIGWWATPARFDSLKFAALSSRVGCEVYLRKNKSGQFEGATDGKECVSSLKGASYATSEVIVEKGQVLSWDRGWNADGIQVWGSVKGPYRFKKKPGK